MKTDKEQYIAPTVEVIEMESQNVMALSDPGFGTTDDPDYTPLIRSTSGGIDKEAPPLTLPSTRRGIREKLPACQRGVGGGKIP